MNYSLAATSAIWTFRDDPNVKAYCKDLEKYYRFVSIKNSMHKVVLEVKDEIELQSVADLLKENNIDRVVWKEQPDNIITAIATKPYTKSYCGLILRHLKLLR